MGFNSIPGSISYGSNDGPVRFIKKRVILRNTSNPTAYFDGQKTRCYYTTDPSQQPSNNSTTDVLDYQFYVVPNSGAFQNNMLSYNNNCINYMLDGIYVYLSNYLSFVNDVTILSNNVFTIRMNGITTTDYSKDLYDIYNSLVNTISIYHTVPIMSINYMPNVGSNNITITYPTIYHDSNNPTSIEYLELGYYNNYNNQCHINYIDFSLFMPVFIS
jgi:hypothetical protein